jgi:hypothetical protein
VPAAEDGWPGAVCAWMLLVAIEHRVRVKAPAENLSPAMHILLVRRLPGGDHRLLDFGPVGVRHRLGSPALAAGNCSCWHEPKYPPPGGPWLAAVLAGRHYPAETKRWQNPPAATARPTTCRPASTDVGDRTAHRQPAPRIRWLLFRAVLIQGARAQGYHELPPPASRVLQDGPQLA